MAQVVGKPGNTPSEAIRNICAIVEERDKLILEKDVKIKFYKNELEKVLDEIKSVEKERRKIADADQFLTKQIEQLESIKTSLEASREVARESLINHQLLEEMLLKQIEIKEKENQAVEQECRNLYNEALETLNQNPLYCELEKQKVEYLKLDIQRRDLEVKIRQKKANRVKLLEIRKKKFYNFFVEMAENYLIVQHLKELEKLKIQESESLKRFFVVQEQLKNKQKLGTSSEKLKKMTRITFGSQEPRIENAQIKAELPQQKKEPKLFNEKLTTMFQQEEPKKIIVPTKVQILNQKIIVPAFVPPTFVPSEKRKNKTLDFSRKWQKRMKKSRDSTKGQILSQDTDKQSSQASQQPEISQSSEESMSEVPVVKEMTPIENTNANQFTPSQENQITSLQRPERVPLIRNQIVDHVNVGTERFGTEKSHVMIGAHPNKYYESNKHYKTGVQNTDININKSMVSSQVSQSMVASQVSQSMVASQVSQQVSTQKGEHVPPVQGQTAENVDFGTQQSKSCPTVFQGNLAPCGAMMQNRLIANSDMSCIKPNIVSSQWERVPKAAVTERSKSVRFNLESANQQAENKSMFGGPSLFGTMFNPFSNQTVVQNETLTQGQIGENNSAFNMTLMDQTGENCNNASDYYPGGDETNPEFSYGGDGNEPQDVQPFGGGGGGSGFFAFTKSQFNPF